MSNSVKKFTISDIQDAIQRADMGAELIPQRFAIGHGTWRATSGIPPRSDSSQNGEPFGTARPFETILGVPDGVLRCYRKDDVTTDDWFEVRINRGPAKPADASERGPIVTGGSTPGETGVRWGESIDLTTIRAHLQVAESNIAQARRLFDKFSMPD